MECLSKYQLPLSFVSHEITQKSCTMFMTLRSSRALLSYCTLSYDTYSTAQKYRNIAIVNANVLTSLRTPIFANVLRTRVFANTMAFVIHNQYSFCDELLWSAKNDYSSNKCVIFLNPAKRNSNQTTAN